VLADGKSLALTGSLTSELAQLVGARVSVRGVVAATPPPITTGLRVHSYDIVEVAGGHPIVGILKEAGGVLFVDSLRLAEVPPELRGKSGTKIWVVGRQGSGGFVITSYGVLSRPRS
jgi:hypothetical protein